MFFSYFRASCVHCSKRSCTNQSKQVMKTTLVCPNQTSFVKQKNFCIFYKQMSSIRHLNTLHRTWTKRLLVDQGIYRKQFYVTNIVRTMSNLLRLRYVLLGTAGAGVIGSKMVRYCVSTIHSQMIMFLIYFMF